MNKNYEQFILMFSAFGAMFFAILALIWGLLAKSQMIMFDGIYSFISLLMTGLSIYAAKKVAIVDDKEFPYGRSELEPMVIIVQSIIMLVICAKAFSYAIVSLFSGGQEVNILSGAVYAGIGVAGCFLWWYCIIHFGKKRAPNSELIKTTGMQWLIDTLLSAAVFIGFIIGYMLQRAGYETYARYVDPIMVLSAVLFFVRQPIVMIIEGIKGIMYMSPGKDIYHALEKPMKEIAKIHGFDDIVLHLGKSGRELICDLSFVSEDPNQARSISEMDLIRNEVTSRFKELFDNPLWLFVSFVHDRTLA
jgi:predicted Co/Zn/Cd cation transporter (cation efflux family)